MGVAQANRMNFGGVVPVGNIVTEHGHNFREIVDAFFGPGAANELFLPKPMNFSVQYSSVKEVTKHRSEMPESADFTVYTPSASEFPEEQSTKVFPPALLSMMKRRIDAVPLQHFTPGRVSVAIHLRRGDLRRNDARAT